MVRNLSFPIGCCVVTEGVVTTNEHFLLQLFPPLSFSFSLSLFFLLSRRRCMRIDFDADLMHFSQCVHTAYKFRNHLIYSLIGKYPLSLEKWQSRTEQRFKLKPEWVHRSKTDAYT